MKLELENKDNNLTLSNSEKEYKSIGDMLYRILRIYMSLYDLKTLPEKEIKFYIATFIVNKLSLDLYSPESDEIHFAIVGKHHKYKRGNFLKKAERMGWLKIKGGDVEYPEHLKQMLLDKKGEITFNLTFKWS